MITVRRSEDRGHFDHGWLDTYHTFSFADYRDPNHRGFRELRVINQDIIQPGAGFGSHPHRDMEIITYVLSGTLEHEDSLGSKAQLPAGYTQVMSAGTGIVHSEANASAEEPVHLLQIWIFPRERGGSARHDERRVWNSAAERGVKVIASDGGSAGGLLINQDAVVSAARLEKDESLNQPLGEHRHAWIQVIRGPIRLGAESLHPGDGAAVSEESALEIQALEDAELLIFDLP